MRYLTKIVCVGLLAALPLHISPVGNGSLTTNSQNLVSLAKWILSVQLGHVVYDIANLYIDSELDVVYSELYYELSTDILAQDFYDKFKNNHSESNANFQVKRPLTLANLLDNSDKKEFLKDLINDMVDRNLIHAIMSGMYKTSINDCRSEMRQRYAIGAGFGSCLLARLLLSLLD